MTACVALLLLLCLLSYYRFPFEASFGYLGGLLGIVGVSWGPLGRLLGTLGRLLKASWNSLSLLEASWAPLGSLLERLGAS